MANFYEVQYNCFLLYLVLVFILRNFCLTHSNKNILLGFLLEVLYFQLLYSGLSTIHVELTFVNGVRSELRLVFFSIHLSSYSSTIYLKDFLLSH